MDEIGGAIERVQAELDDLKRLAPQQPRNGNGDGNGDGDGEPPPPVYNDNLKIVGVEVTQGVQCFNFNGQGTAVLADNGIPLIARKTTVIRVYVDRRSSPSFPIPNSITGMCSVWIPAVLGVGAKEVAGSAPLIPCPVRCPVR